MIVYDALENARNRLVSKGARAAASLEALAKECDRIFLCLPTSDQVRAVVLGEGGLRNYLKTGSLIIDQTTGDPRMTRSLASELAGDGVTLIDAPVSGGTQVAEAGTIAIMVGAEREHYELVLPLLSSISSNVFHAGGIGNGQVVKLVNNLRSTAQRLLSFEALSLAAKNGVEPKTAVDILVASGGRNAYLERVLGPRVLNGKLNIGFTLGLAHKDVRLACQLGQDSGVPMFFGNLTRELYQMCIGEMGRENQVDTAGLMFDRLAGSHVVPEIHDLAPAGSQDRR